MFYGAVVMALITRSITGFSLHVGHDVPHIGHLWPDIWVDGKKLYQYQTQVDVARQKYVLTSRHLFDPYQYRDMDDGAVVMTILAP